MQLEVKHLSDSGNQSVRNLPIEDVSMDWGYESSPGECCPAIKLFVKEGNPYYLLNVHTPEVIYKTIAQLLQTGAESLCLPIDIFDPTLATHDACAWTATSYFNYLDVSKYAHTQAFQIFNARERTQLILGSTEPLKSRAKAQLVKHWRARLPIPQKNISKLNFFNEILDRL